MMKKNASQNIASEELSGLPWGPSAKIGALQFHSAHSSSGRAMKT